MKSRNKSKPTSSDELKERFTTSTSQGGLLAVFFLQLRFRSRSIRRVDLFEATNERERRDVARLVAVAVDDVAAGVDLNSRSLSGLVVDVAAVDLDCGLSRSQSEQNADGAGLARMLSIGSPLRCCVSSARVAA